MRKYFHGSVLFLCIVALCISGCGGGSAADPMGTGTVTLTADSTEVEPGGSCTLTATVTNIRATGASVPVVGETVSFAVLTDNGGTISFANDKTGAGGVARATYTAGNNLIPDTVRVITSVGATATVTINKTGAPRGKVVDLTADPAEVEPLGFVEITATVTDSGVDRFVEGERVTFTLMTSNGASLSAQSGTTNASGEVTTMYQAGNNDIQDVVKATLANGATAEVIITKTGTGPGTVITFNPATLSVAPGSFSTISATVTNSADAVSGVTVYFWLSTSNGTINQSQVTTDGNGQASVLYTAGNSLNSDVLWASTAGGASTSLIITKTGGAVGSYTVTVTAAPTTLATDTSPSIVTATVKDNQGKVVSDVTVNFTVSGSAPLGTLSVASGVTDASGNVVTTFTGGGVHATGETNVVTAMDNSNTYSGAVIITYP